MPGKDLVAQGNARVADEDARPSDVPQHLIGRFTAEGASELASDHVPGLLLSSTLSVATTLMLGNQINKPAAPRPAACNASGSIVSQQTASFPTRPGVR